MKVNIQLEDFQATFPSLLDKEQFEAIGTDEPGTWIIRKKIVPKTSEQIATELKEPIQQNDGE